VVNKTAQLFHIVSRQAAAINYVRIFKRKRLGRYGEGAASKELLEWKAEPLGCIPGWFCMVQVT